VKLPALFAIRRLKFYSRRVAAVLDPLEATHHGTGRAGS
jgi:hypothetical protein